MAIDLKQQAKQFIEEVYSQGKLELIEQLIDPKYEGVDPLVGKFDREGLKQQVMGYRNAFPDLKLEATDVLGEGDTVVVRWRATGTHRGPLGKLEPTGKSATVTGITWSRYENGKVVRDFTEWDALGLYRALGAEGAMQPGAAAEAPKPEARH